MLRIYILFVIAIVGFCFIGIIWTQNSGIGGALRKLGRSNSEYAQARNQLLLGTADPMNALVGFAADPKKSIAARSQALQILQELSGRKTIQLDSIQIHHLLSDTTRDMRLITLAALEKIGCANDVFAFTTILHQARDTAMFQQSWRTLKSAMGPVRGILMDPSDDARKTIDSCAAVQEHVPYGKAEEFSRLAAYYQSKGDTADARRFMIEFRYLSHWWITGSWDNKKMAGFYNQYSPEKRAFDPNDTFMLDDGSIARWIPIDTLKTETWGVWVDLLALLLKKTYATAYIVTYLHSPSDQDALLLFGTDDGVKVWVNDSLVFGNKIFRACQADDDAVRIHLHKGANKIMAKILQDVGGWGFQFRVADMNGDPMPEVVCSRMDTVVEGQGTH
jgi:hypothetical protein